MQHPLNQLLQEKQTKHVFLTCRHASDTCREQGVYAHFGSWMAQIKLCKKDTHLGTYASKQEAGVVWDAASVWKAPQEPPHRFSSSSSSSSRPVRCSLGRGRGNGSDRR